LEERRKRDSMTMGSENMEFKKIIYEEDVEKGIAKIIINNPPLNVLDSEALKELFVIVDHISKNNLIRVAIIRGSGERAFSAGANLKEFAKYGLHESKEAALLGHKVMNAIASSPKPFIAAVNGYALGGGCELALACDIIIASENARFGNPEVTLGIIPGWGATQRLPKIIGEKKAKELLLTGNVITAEEALKLGIINKVTSLEELDKVAEEIALKIAKNAPLAVSAVKQLVNKSFEVSLDAGILLEVEAFSSCFTTEDKNEGIQAFFEKREPKFKGR